MDIRKQILETDDTTIEIVDVPEWGVKVRVKSLTINEQNALMEAVRLRTGTEQSEYRVDRDKFATQLLIRTCVDDNGDMLFEQADAQALSRKSGAAVGRIVKVASRLAGVSEGQVEDTVDQLKGTAPEG